MKDSLIIASQYSTTDPDIYNKYNGQSYALNTKDKTIIITHKKNRGNNDYLFYFEDTSAYAFQPSFEVVIKNTLVHELQSAYDLTDNNKIQVNYYQRFKDFSMAVNMNGKVISGTLKIRYDKMYNTVSGEVTNLQVPIDFYMLDDSAPTVPPDHTNELIKNGGSTRTVSLTFNYAKVDDAP